MKVKIFNRGSWKGKPVDRFNDLEVMINTWLAEHPDVAVEHVHRLSQPTFGWGELAIAVWYSEPDE